MMTFFDMLIHVKHSNILLAQITRITARNDMLQLGAGLMTLTFTRMLTLFHWTPQQILSSHLPYDELHYK